ncbi:hypothetical protein Pla108_09930 [Botrimarina colliarenosi]|uniref:2-oxoadipate dioxygenase/decarboxylase n=1 Tax=Botrimarina colliarenosi TaxID=2528001 RepID=A0A5C6AK70_9BACT|nr:DUF1338 domain-containing protein [Botrimarina colliarenosi]TWU00050.1 hypothetical protein Pla108_09930 [Botrimarina colliarenosi]
MNANEFFDHLWSDYVAMTPQAGRIKSAFEDRGERVVNDHVAFRTLALEPIGLKALEPHLLAVGYTPYEPYDFKDKKLSAYGYLPPEPELPRVFLSELRVNELSPAAAKILEGLAAQVDPARVADPSVLWAGPLWEPVSWEDYQTLQAESEYAAWVASIGIRPNHFTIGINYLEKTTSVEEVLQVVEGLGYQVNDSGGRVKGTPAVLLEQGSTLADRMPIEFAGGDTHEVPTCYYEFAKRYPTESGELYPGFVAASADKIFESTDAKR